MGSGKAIALLKSATAAMALVCVIALAVHPAGIGLALVGLLFVPVLLWRLNLAPNDELPIKLEPRKLSQPWVLVSRFQRPPPPLL